MKNIFLVKSPLQLLNSVEARHHYDLERDDCVLVIMGDRKSQPQIMNLANTLQEWGRVIVLNQVGLLSGDALQPETESSSTNNRWLGKSIFNVWRLNRISRALGEVDYIFVGYIRYVYMRHFVNSTRHRHTVLLDDGNATIQLAKDRMTQIEKPDLGKRIKLWTKQLFQGIKPDYPASVSFFTVYPVEVNSNDRLEQHHYAYLRTQTTANEISRDVYFLGSPLSQVGTVTQDEYVEHLARVKQYFSDKPLRYVAHRRESDELLGRLRQELGFDITHFDYPIEYQLAFIGPKPSILASFTSSALDNCSQIFGAKLDIVSFRLNLENSPKRKEVEAFYQRYQSLISENFIVVSDY